MSGDTITKIIILAVLILLSAYFSATETAFSSLNKTRLKTLAGKGKSRAVLACQLAENYDKLISTILIGNNIVNIAAASIGTVLFVDLCGEDIGATVSTIVITVVVLVFGEVTPKSIAKDAPESFAMFSAPIIRFLIRVFTPLNYAFSAWKKLVGKLFKLESASAMSQEELLMLVDEVQSDGGIDRSEGELLRAAIEFTDLEAGEILTHRVDLEAVALEMSKEEISTAFAESGYSRLLVYEGSIDNVVGVLHRRDFYGSGGITKQPVEDILRPVVFVTAREKISSLLKRLQKNKTHVAVVLDEFGGTYGIVTMEDILEELVGEIWDEHDEIVENFRKLDEKTTVVNGGVDMDDFQSYFQVEIDTESVAFTGWLMERQGRLPRVGDQLRCGPLDIHVSKVEHNRVAEAVVKRI